MTFIGRSLELQLLEERFASGRGELFVLYGRRRVGKSEMLAQFCKDKQAIYFTASQAETQDNLFQFVSIVQRHFKDVSLDGMNFRDIEAVLTYLAARAEHSRLVVVLDEFQYWVTGNKAIPSMLQRFWDNTGRSSNLVLVLCGSSISMMVEHVLAERAPLYGRRTGQLELKPFDYRTAGKFFPQWSSRDKLKAYGVLGGIPAYLCQFDKHLSFEENLQTQILKKGTYLSEEASFLLKTELRDTKVYASILRAIAGGNTSMKDLTTKMDMDARAISTYLSNLQSLHLIEREISLADRAPEKSRKGRYFIQDNFLNFWFRFVEPNITFLEIHRGSELFRQTIKPQLDTYMGRIFEGVSRQFVLYYGRAVGLPVPRRFGKIWDKDFDIDVAAENADGSYTMGECKWSANPVDTSIVLKLKQRSEKSGLRARNIYFVLFSSAGFKDKADAETILVDEKTLYKNGG